jgi:hypothetical protein
MYYKNTNTKEKNFFLWYLLFLFFSASIFLLNKHNVGNDFTISEWLINYHGGFTRRGFLGELAFNLATLFKAKIRFVILLLQIFFYLIFIVLTFNFIKDLKINFLSRVALYTPIFLLYPLAEIEVLVRKETIIFILFIIFLNLASNKYSPKYSNIYIFFIFPISFVIWEPVIFFFPFIFFILYLKNFKKNILQTIFRISFISSPSFTVFLLVILNPLSENGHEKMCKDLMFFFQENCYMALTLLKTKSTILQQFTENIPSYKIEYFLRHILIILIGFMPLFILTANSELYKKKANLFFKFKSFLIPLIILLSLTPICFAAMYDWGRVVNISYTFSIFTYFFLIKNNYIIFKENRSYLSIKKIFNNKNYYYILFFIYCFCWNIKTVITDKIGSVPIYRIITKSAKILINY